MASYSNSTNKHLFIFEFTSLHSAWLQSRSVSYETHPKRASRFIAPIFGAHPPHFSVPDSDSESLTHAQLLTFSYAPQRSLKDFILIKTLFFDYTPGVPEVDADTGRRLLEVDEWVDVGTMRPRSVCCLGCSHRVVFTAREYDVRGWQKHRDGCAGIEDMMVRHVMRGILKL